MEHLKAPGEVLIYFSVRGRAAEQGIIFRIPTPGQGIIFRIPTPGQGIIFRIPTPGQGIIFVKISSMTGSIFVIFDSERSFSAICTLQM